MKDLYKHIESFDQDWNPDAEMLRKYFSGELNESDHYKVEKWISLDDFGDDIGDLKDSPELSIVDWGHLKEITSPITSKSINQAIAYIISSIGILAFLFFAQTGSPTHVESESAETYVIKEIQAKKAIEIQKIKATFNEFSNSTISLSQVADLKPVAEIHDNKRLQKKIIMIPKKESPKIIFIPKRLKKVENHSVKYILQFKVVDYFNEYLSGREYLNGLQSEYASAQEQELLEKNAKTITVDDVLQAGLEAFYKRDYYLAIHHFDKILTHYPDDLNAKFYSALSCYKLKDYDTTIKLLQDVAENDINVFLQEAEWYLAKSHYKIGETNQTLNLLDIIIRSKGFYEKKAIDFRNEVMSN